ncbi:MAG: extracellular solute-binding protein [Actinomycetales bacterium]|nr:extracellular solute-binding protein [Actinomycetales bacterium]
MGSTMYQLNARPRVAFVATATASALLLAACSGGGGDGSDGAPAGDAITQEEIDAAMSTETDLTFWTWVPDIQNEVDLFEAEYPAMNVEVVNVGQGASHYQKLRTALESGTGAPDVVQIEFQHLPSFRLGEHLLDLAPYGAADISGDYAEWIWSQVSDGEAVYGVPQDVGPMGTLYREDLLMAAGIEPPTTWDEFAEAARTFRAQNPDQYLVNLPGNDAGQFVGLLWQAGARPFGYDGAEAVSIDLQSPEVMQVVNYWNTLISEDVVSVDPDFTDQWYQGLASGKYASWHTAAWGPVFLQGTAGDTSGLWRAGPLPQWDEEAAGNWGGSTDAVLTTTQNPIAAAALALWINTEPEPALMFATEQFLFPASNEILNDPEFIDQESEFYGGQTVNQEFAAISETVSPDFQWLPFMDYAYSAFGETLGKAIADRTDLATAVVAWEEALTTYAVDQGFTVE